MPELILYTGSCKSIGTLGGKRRVKKYSINLYSIPLVLGSTLIMNILSIHKTLRHAAATDCYLLQGLHDSFSTDINTQEEHLPNTASLYNCTVIFNFQTEFNEYNISF